MKKVVFIAIVIIIIVLVIRYKKKQAAAKKAAPVPAKIPVSKTLVKYRPQPLTSVSAFKPKPISVSSADLGKKPLGDPFILSRLTPQKEVQDPYLAQWGLKAKV